MITKCFLISISLNSTTIFFALLTQRLITLFKTLYRMNTERKETVYKTAHSHNKYIYICQIQKPHWQHINQKAIKRQDKTAETAEWRTCILRFFFSRLSVAPWEAGVGLSLCFLPRPSLGLGERPAHCQGHSVHLHDYTNYQAGIHVAPPWDLGNVLHTVKVTVHIHD